LRPSIEPGAGALRRTIETFVFDFSADLYGARRAAGAVARLRPEKKFASLDELKGQIAQDVALARGMLHRPGGT
jgi:riboflavin kinase/FMN adenylyltransferase